MGWEFPICEQREMIFSNINKNLSSLQPQVEKVINDPDNSILWELSFGIQIYT